jgi:hypothetical protein
MISFGVVFRLVSALSREHDEGLDDKKIEELDISVQIWKIGIRSCLQGLFAGQKYHYSSAETSFLTREQPTVISLSGKSPKTTRKQFRI